MAAVPPELEALRARAQMKLGVQYERARRYQRYYDGEQNVPAILNTDERRTFVEFLRESAANWCELVVNAVAERMQVTGFRFGSDADSAAAWALWQASDMDADAELVQTDALVSGSSSVLVQPDDGSPSGVSISGESPLEACVIYQRGNRRRAEAGYKRYLDQPGGQFVEYLFTPDVIVTWMGSDFSIAPNPGAVLIEMTPQPRTAGYPRSELHSALPIQDRINTTLFNRLVATDYGAFRQVWATGVRMARKVVTEEDGSEKQVVVKPFDVGANRLLVNESPEARFGSFPESTLAGYLSSVEQDVNQLAAITQTPPHYLLGQMVNLSADAIKAAEAGLVAKIRRRALHIGEAWEHVIRAALSLTGRPGAADFEAEVIWADFETRSEGQRVDALVKMGSLGVPRAVLWEKWGATQQEIDRWEKMVPLPSPAPVPAPLVNVPPSPPGRGG